MKICTAKVTDNSKFSETFELLALVEGIEESVPITYVSPFFGNAGAGMVAIPPVDQPILVGQTEKGTDWYYLGSIMSLPWTSAKDPTDLKEDITVSPADRVDPEIYKATGLPKKIVVKDEMGNQISLNHSLGEEVKRSGVELKSSTGKTILMEDIGEASRLSIKNEHNDGITITSNDSFIDAARTIKSVAAGSQEMFAEKGRMYFHLGDGRDITIHNSSTGWNRSIDDIAVTQCKNINIQSDNGSVNISSRAEFDGTPGNPSTSKIALECIATLNPTAAQIIQLLTTSPNSVILINSSGKIVLQAGENGIDIQTVGPLNINSTGKLNLGSNTGIDIKSTGSINIDGAVLNLNSGSNSPVLPVPTIPAVPDYPLGVGFPVI